VVLLDEPSMGLAPILVAEVFASSGGSSRRA
jgi:ABC-type branched-subunit amino acid transport system ATPase component